MLVVPRPGNADRAAGDRGQCEEVAGGRGVRFDREVPSAVMRGVDVKTTKLAVADLGPEGFHHGKRHGDIGLRNENALHFDGNSSPGIRARHQQTAEELAGGVTAHSAVPAFEAAGVDRDGRAAGTQVAPDADS